MKEDSIISRRLGKDRMLSNDFQPHTIVLSNQMILNVKSAHQRYKDQQRLIAETTKKETNELAKIVVSDENKDVEATRDQLKKTSEMLHKDFIKFVREAENKHTSAFFNQEMFFWYKWTLVISH